MSFETILVLLFYFWLNSPWRRSLQECLVIPNLGFCSKHSFCKQSAQNVCKQGRTLGSTNSSWQIWHINSLIQGRFRSEEFLQKIVQLRKNNNLLLSVLLPPSMYINTLLDAAVFFNNRNSDLFLIHVD